MLFRQFLNEGISLRIKRKEHIIYKKYDLNIVRNVYNARAHKKNALHIPIPIEINETYTCMF